MKTNKPPSDGLEWLREIRADIQRDIGATPQQRAAYYQRREKSLNAHIYHPPHSFAPDDEASCVLREDATAVLSRALNQTMSRQKDAGNSAAIT